MDSFSMGGVGKMKNWILDRLPQLFVILLVLFAYLMIWNYS